MTVKKTPIEFTKMQAAGNDFILINNLDENLAPQKIINLAPELCDRHFGIGADGIIALQPPEIEDGDYTMFFRNADGSDAGMCGNGARCLALFAKQQGINNENLKFNVHDKTYKASFAGENQVEILFPVEVQVIEVQVDGETVFKTYTGTEHIVKQLPAKDLKNDELLVSQGSMLRNHAEFSPPGTNVNFIHGLSKNTLFLRTYERGVEGLTLACGTGAVASAIVWHYLQNKSKEKHHSTIIQADGGTIQVGFNYNINDKKYSKITLSGEANFVFEGKYEI